MNSGNKILLVLSILTIIAGVIIAFEATAFQKKAIVTTGTVTDRHLSSYHVKYQSEDGSAHDLYVSTKRNTRNDGDQIKLFYRADNPAKARISDGKKTGKNVIIIGIILLAFDLYLVYSGKKQVSNP